MIESDIRKLLQKIAIQTGKSYTKSLRDLGLYLGQELALYHLWKEDGITQSQLRKKTGTKASTTSNMLKKLECDQIVYRKNDAEDSRISKVFLTDKGRELQEPIEKIWEQHEEQLFQGVLPEELLLMRRILEQMSANLPIDE